jgi:arginyl-tRNA synthetase
MLNKKLKENIKKAFKELFVIELKNEEIKIGTPPDIKMGDVALECFLFAKKVGQSPGDIALKLAGKIEKDEIIEEVQAIGPYVNFKINKQELFGSVYQQIISGTFLTDNLKSKNGEKKKKIMVEYLSPNTNKPLHLGHLRNGSLGMAVSNLLEANGNEVVKANLINDRGVHICKSMLAWKLFSEGETPESTGMKGDHFVGKYYVKFSKESEKNPELEEQAQEMLKKWEEGDEEVLELWNMMNEWVFTGFNESFKTFGFNFDVIYKESKTYKLGKDIIEAGLKKGIFKKEESGAVTFLLPDSFGLDEKGKNKKITVLREDGTSVYVTQDLGTSVYKAEEHSLNESIYVVGSEQEYYFKSLFEILKALEYSWAENNHHLSYGMVYLPDGKMKSREGKVVDADDLVIKVKEMAKKGIREHQETDVIDDIELEERAMKISLGAIKFYLLKVGPTQIIHFNPEESLSFEGFTGPYCQYAYARGAKLLRDAGVRKSEKIEVDFSMLGTNEESQLIQKVLESGDKIKKAGVKFNPSLVAVHIFELAKTFNQFYHSDTILKAEDNIKMARLALVQIFLQTIQTELNLLGIDTLDEM